MKKLLLFLLFPLVAFAQPATVTISPHGAVVQPGGTVTFSATCTPNPCATYGAVTFESSLASTGRITVNSTTGLMVGVGTPPAGGSIFGYVVATVDGVTDQAGVDIQNPVDNWVTYVTPDPDIALDTFVPSSTAVLNIAVGASIPLGYGNTINSTAPNPLNETCTWSSSNTAVATIDKLGEVTAIAPGTVTMTCNRAGNGVYGTSSQPGWVSPGNTEALTVVAGGTGNATWYVRPDGGTPFVNSTQTPFGQCTGLSDAPYSNFGFPTIFWLPGTPYSLDTYTADYNGNYQKITTAGTTRTVPDNVYAPVTWNLTTGGTTTDGTAVWTNEGPYPVGQACGLQNPRYLYADGTTYAIMSWMMQGGDKAIIEPNPAGYNFGGEAFGQPINCHGNVNQCYMPHIPSGRMLAKITNVAVTSGIATVTASNSLTSGQSVMIGDPLGLDIFKSQMYTVSATGLSSSQFQVPLSGPNVTSIADVGVVAQPTQFLGSNYQSCKSDAAKTILDITYLAFTAFNESDSQFVNLSCLDITDRASYGQGNFFNTPLCDNNGLNDCGGNSGIRRSAAASYNTMTDVKTHGIDTGVYGPAGVGTVDTRLFVSNNLGSGIDMDDVPYGISNISVAGGYTLNDSIIQFSGCLEEYPLVHTFQSQECHDTNTGGDGDGFGTASTIGNWSFDHDLFYANMQDGLDLLHSGMKSLIVTNSRSVANDGQAYKLGSGSTVVFNNNISDATCDRVLFPFGDEFPGARIASATNAPTITGLNISYTNGQIVINSVVLNTTGASWTLTANADNYMWIDPTTLTVLHNTTGFPSDVPVHLWLAHMPTTGTGVGSPVNTYNTQISPCRANGTSVLMSFVDNGSYTVQGDTLIGDNNIHVELFCNGWDICPNAQSTFQNNVVMSYLNTFNGGTTVAAAFFEDNGGMPGQNGFAVQENNLYYQVKNCLFIFNASETCGTVSPAFVNQPSDPVSSVQVLDAFNFNPTSQISGTTIASEPLDITGALRASPSSKGAVQFYSSPTTTTTTLTATSTTPTAGTPITINATLTPLPAIGQLTFFDGSTNLGTLLLQPTTNSAPFTTAALTPGVHPITAQFQALGDFGQSTSSVTNVNVGGTAPTLTSIALAPNPGSVAVGSTLTLTCTSTFSDSSTAPCASPVWTSATPSHATVGNGVVTGVAAGTSVISATIGSISGSSTVTVTGGSVTLTSIAVTPNPESVSVGSTVTLTCTSTFSDSSTAPCSSPTWTSATTSVATVNSSGVVTGVAAGSSIVTAAIGSISGNSTVNVSSTPPPSQSIVISGSITFSGSITLQ